jgi:hypothetical protein
MGLAWLDLTPGADAEVVLADLRDGTPREEPGELTARVVPRPEGARIELYAGGLGYSGLAKLGMGTIRRTGRVRRAIVVLDHDEYGAEHAVLDGAGRRVHHVCVLPRDEDTGEVYYADEPSVLSHTTAAHPDGLVDGPAALLAAAELYEVPVARLRAAAVKATDAHRALGVVGEPFSMWLDAVGVPWYDEGIGRRVRLRPEAVWPVAVSRFLIPELYGAWTVLDDAVVKEPVGFVAAAVVRIGSALQATVQPLYLPEDGWRVNGSIRLCGPWEDFKSAEEGQTSMRRLAQVIEAEAVPYLNRYGSLEGFLLLCQEANAAHRNGIGDPYRLHDQARTEVVLQRYGDAAETFSSVRKVAGTVGTPPAWLTALVTETTAARDKLLADPDGLRAELLSNVPRQKAELGLV